MSYYLKTGHLLQVGETLAAPGGRSSYSEYVVKMNMTNFSPVPLIMLVIEGIYSPQRTKNTLSLFFPLLAY